MKDLDYSKAKKEYLDAIKLKPEKSKPYLGLADLYIIQDKPEEAQKVLEKAVKYVDDSHPMASFLFLMVVSPESHPPPPMYRIWGRTFRHPESAPHISNKT